MSSKPEACTHKQRVTFARCCPAVEKAGEKAATKEASTKKEKEAKGAAAAAQEAGEAAPASAAKVVSTLPPSLFTIGKAHPQEPGSGVGWSSTAVCPVLQGASAAAKPLKGFLDRKAAPAARSPRDAPPAAAANAPGATEERANGASANGKLTA